jgi:glucose dehydrogenase
MRDRRSRAALVGLVLVFPVLMVGMSPAKTSVREAVLPVLATEAILVVGLTGVARERGRLLAERAAPARRAAHNLPHASRPLRRAPVVR